MKAYMKANGIKITLIQEQNRPRRSQSDRGRFRV